MKNTTPYGALLRERRVQAKLSLREVAEHIGVSHVFLADIERGVTTALKPDREPALLEALPNLTRGELDAARKASQLKITISSTPPKYVDLTMAFARRLEEQNLDESSVLELLRILNEDVGND